MTTATWLRTYYPHMLADEVPIWNRFLQTTNLNFIKIDYDVHLGQGMIILPTDNDSIRRLKLAVTRKRVDAIAETPQDIWILEVKPRIGASALAQLLLYFDLYHDEYHPTKGVMLAAIGETQAPDIQRVFDLYAVNIILV